MICEENTKTSRFTLAKYRSPKRVAQLHQGFDVVLSMEPQHEPSCDDTTLSN